MKEAPTEQHHVLPGDVGRGHHAGSAGRVPHRSLDHYGLCHPSSGGKRMITSLPDLNALLTPVLTWALAGISVIAAIILVWNIYETWTQNPERFSWFAALFK